MVCIALTKLTETHLIPLTGPFKICPYCPNKHASCEIVELTPSQDADYFIHLKQQFPLYPKRYHSHSTTEAEGDPCQIDVGSSPVSGELNLADALQLECESIVEQQLPTASNQGSTLELMSRFHLDIIYKILGDFSQVLVLPRYFN